MKFSFPRAFSSILTISAVSYLATAVIAGPVADWPGVWAEAEAGKTAEKPSSIQYASGHLAVDLQTKAGEVAIDINPATALPGAIFTVRYCRDAADTGTLDVYLAPAGDVTVDRSRLRQLGHLDLPSTGRQNEWRWLRLAAGDIPAGPQRLVLICPTGQSAGYIDLVGLLPGDTRGLWQPPNDVQLGNFRDNPKTVPAFDLLSVKGQTFGDLLPEATYVGGSATKVTYSLNVRNNQFPAELNLNVHGELLGDDGKTIQLPAEQVKVPADTTQPVDYAFSLPAAGHFALKLIPEAGEVSASAGRWLTTVPAEPIWVTPDKKDGLPITSPGETSSIDLDVPADLPSALVYVSYQRRTRDDSQGSARMEILVGPATAKSITDAGVRDLGMITLDPLPRFGPQWNWAAVNAGPLPTGKYRLFFHLSKQDGAAADPAIRPANNLIKRIGVVADLDHGRWLPPIDSIDSKNVVTTQDAQLMPEAVRVDAINCSEAGQLFLGSKVLDPKPAMLPFSVTLQSNIVTEHVTCFLLGRLIDSNGVVKELGSVSVGMGPGERTTIDYPIRAPGFGWFSIEITARVLKLDGHGHSSFGVLLDPHDGVRENSMFGLAVGETPIDAKVAKLIGVKWRRGIPFTNPADVVHKTGDPLVKKPDDKITLWTDADIQKARDVIALWKQSGVMCLGYVNYNLPWNCLGGAAGGWHKNRPADMQEHVDMVYHLIQPLHDEVKYWEIWNEPWVGGWTWRTGTAQDYRDMCKMIWDRVKPEMPDVQLIGGGSTSYDRDVLFAAGSNNAGFVDGVSSHPYGKPDTNHPSFAAVESAMLKKFAQNGGKGGIWATELGTAAFMFDPLPRTEADLMVARTVAPLYLLAKLGAGETPIRLFFFASQYGAGQFSGGEHNWWDATGGSPAPRPALVAFSAMTHFVEDAKLVGDIYSAAKGAWALHFVKDDGSSVVVFLQEQSAAGDIDPVHANDSERAKGEMILPAGDFQIFDFLGRPIGTREGANLRIPTQVWEARYIVSKLPVDQVRSAMLGAKFTGLPTLTVNPRSFDAPLSMKPKLRFKVENMLPQTVDAKLDITAPAELQLVSTSADLAALKPGEVRWVDFDLTSATPNDINRYVIKYKVTIGSDVEEEQQAVQVACATYGSPKIDGDLADWSKAIPVTMLSRGGKDWRQITMDPSQAAALLAHKSPSDTAVYKFMTQWDEQNFYAAAIVPAGKQDLAVPYDGPISTTKNMPFMHDCVQMAFASLVADNPDDLLKANALYDKGMAAGVDYEFCAAMLSNGQSEIDRLKAPGTNYQTFYPTNAQTTPPLAPISGKDASAARVVVRYDTALNAYLYELAIPWTNVHELGDRLRTLQPGQRLMTNFAFAVNDTAGVGRTFWTQEAGDLEAGSYGFDPTWGGGARKLGGRIVTDWGFCR